MSVHAYLFLLIHLNVTAGVVTKDQLDCMNWGELGDSTNYLSECSAIRTLAVNTSAATSCPAEILFGRFDSPCKFLPFSKIPTNSLISIVAFLLRKILSKSLYKFIVEWKTVQQKKIRFNFLISAGLLCTALSFFFLVKRIIFLPFSSDSF